MRPGTNFAIVIVILAVLVALMLLVVFGPLNVKPGHGEQIRSVKTLEPSYTIIIQNSTFDPTYLTVLAGTTVTWKNPASHAQVNGLASDKMANGTRVFDSGPLKAGDSYSYKFNEVGNFSYHSVIQYYNNGSVNVIPNAPESLVTPAPIVPEGFPTAVSVLRVVPTTSVL